jgi:hypothetical protein
MAPLHDETPAVPADPRADLRVFRAKDPYIALGLAVSHLMTKPAFAKLQFGDWSRILTGQINRKHYYFAVDSKNQIQGFIGWALEGKSRGLGRRPRRGDLRGQPGRRLPDLQRLGGEHARGEPLSGLAGARDHTRQGHGLLQAPLQGRQHAPRASARQ